MFTKVFIAYSKFIYNLRGLSLSLSPNVCMSIVLDLVNVRSDSFDISTWPFHLNPFCLSVAQTIILTEGPQTSIFKPLPVEMFTTSQTTPSLAYLPVWLSLSFVSYSQVIAMTISICQLSSFHVFISNSLLYKKGLSTVCLSISSTSIDIVFSFPSWHPCPKYRHFISKI